MSTLTNPHDKFFKTVFSKKEVAVDFLRNYLPAEVLDLLEPESLGYIKESFVDPHLREFFSDLVFTVSLKTGASGLLYILLEHKSYQDPHTALYLLRYILNQWEQSLTRPKAERFPAIIPVVLYHGPTAWNAGTSLRALVHYPDALQTYLPDFHYILWDAAAYDDDDITGIAVLQATLLLFKHIFQPDLRDRLSDIFGLLRDLVTARSGIEFLITIIKYILNASPADHIGYDDVKRAVDEAFPHIGGTIMPTIADVMRQEAFEQGLAQGMEQALEQGLEQGLERGLTQGIIQNGREAVLEILEIRFERVPAPLTEQVQALDDPAFLKRLHRQALQVDSLEAFEALLEKSPA
jgi:predicted transposase/invertase (TIGR01784 family)